MVPGNIDVTGATAEAVAAHLPGECQAVSSILSRVGDKWTVLVVMMLADGPRRFNELKRMIGGVSQRMLTLTLRGLERDGMVTRTIYPTIPPRVDYELTEARQSLREPLEALGQWAFAHIPVVEKARDEFDARSDSTPPKPLMPMISPGASTPTRYSEREVRLRRSDEQDLGTG